MPTTIPNVVKKLWGSEEWIYNGPAGYCMKTLMLNPGFQSSLHFHPVKHETFLVVAGECEMEVDGSVERMVAGQGHIIPPNTKHRFRAVNGPCVVVEASTHHDDADVVRLEESKEIR
jgi:quercetin dioxygenase-like cupin family protein